MNRMTTYIIAALLLICGFLLVKNLLSNRVEISDSAMVTKITSMGKLELVKYTMKDIIEQKRPT